MSKAPRVVLQPDIARVLEAICFLIAEAKRRNVTVTQYDIVKSLFLADKAHLNKYGRPITFDNYVAMKAGPVPSVAYDLLKENEITKKRYGVTNLPWSRSPAPEAGSLAFAFTGAKSKYDEDVLSPSDVKALSEALTKIKGLTFGQIKRLTHEDPAYKEAWQGDGAVKKYDISLGLLFDSPNHEAAEHIQFMSRHR